MLEITERVPSAGEPGDDVRPHDRLELPFELRTKTRQRVRLASGEEAALMLVRGVVLRGGDLLRASDGRVIEVVARREAVLHVECDTPQALARAAYHLGNRHVPVEVGEGYLRVAADHVLEQMLKGLGARVNAIEAAFEPESGAYGSHSHGPVGHHHHTSATGRIHEYRRIHSHDRDETSD